VIAAGPVITEPSNGPSVRIANHQEAGVPPPIADTLVIAVSVCLLADLKRFVRNSALYIEKRTATARWCTSKKFTASESEIAALLIDTAHHELRENELIHRFKQRTA
jgi:hypothetical protein